MTDLLDLVVGSIKKYLTNKRSLWLKFVTSLNPQTLSSAHLHFKWSGSHSLDHPVSACLLCKCKIKMLVYDIFSPTKCCCCENKWPKFYKKKLYLAAYTVHYCEQTYLSIYYLYIFKRTFDNAILHYMEPQGLSVCIPWSALVALAYGTQKLDRKHNAGDLPMWEPKQKLNTGHGCRNRLISLFFCHR